MVPYAHSHHYRRGRSSCRRPECRTGTPPRAGAPWRQITLLSILLDSGCSSVQGRLLGGRRIQHLVTCARARQYHLLGLPLTDLCQLADVATALHDVVLDAGFVELLASIEFYLVQPIGAVRCLLDERSKLRLYPGRRRYVLASSSDGTHCRGHRLLNAFGYR